MLRGEQNNTINLSVIQGTVLSFILDKFVSVSPHLIIFRDILGKIFYI